MANAVYPLYKQNLLAGTAGFDLDNDTTTDGPYCDLVDTGVYTYNTAHDFFNDVTGVVGTTQRITTPTVANGTFDGADLTYTAVSGATVEALVLSRHNSGANTTWPLFLYLDSSVTGLPVTPNGGNITVTWNASGIFTLSDGNAKEDVIDLGHFGPAHLYEYSYRGESDRHVGLIAQEVEQWCPDAVLHDALGSLSAVNYGRAMEAAARMQ